MSSLHRVLRIVISIINIIIATLVITSVWPFATGEFSVDLPRATDIDWGYSGGLVTLSAPVTVRNAGFYNIDDVIVRTSVTNSTKFELINATERWGRIPAGSVFGETVNFSIDFNSLMSSGADWMVFNPDFFEIEITISCRYTLGLIGFSAEYKLPYSWDGLIIDFGFGRGELESPSPGVYQISQPYYVWTNSILSGYAGDFSLDLRVASSGNLTASSTDHIVLGRNYSDSLVLAVSQADYLYLLSNNETFIATITLDFPGLPPMQQVRIVNWIAPIYW
ncbi:MAG: hypothetical protein QW505_06020 [Thermoplasmata archaeon]